MKIAVVTLLFIFIIRGGFTQDINNIDSLKKTVFTQMEDSDRMNLYLEVGGYYNYKYPDSVLLYAKEGLNLARKLNDKKSEITALTQIGEAWTSKGNYPKSLEIKMEAFHEAEKLNDPFLIASCNNYLGAIYIRTKDYEKSLLHYRKAQENELYFKEFKKQIFAMVGRCYYYLKNNDSANYYAQQAYELELRDQHHWTVPYYLMAEIAARNGNNGKALEYYRAGNQVVKVDALDIINGYQGIAAVYKKMGLDDSAIYYAKKVVADITKRPLYNVIVDASSLLTDIYKSNHNLDSAFKYIELMQTAKDSLFSQENVTRIQNLTFNEQQRVEQLDNARIQAREEYQTEVKLYSLVAGLFVLLLLASILYRNIRLKQQNNALLEKKNKEIQTERNNLEKILTELKAAQAQLIQSEKMASLGELTAGIAHEIQNPLNFVNNFSEVNKEMLEELKAERLKPKAERDETLEDELVNDVITNEQKINHHGKRAGDIVKGMLQHSRSSTGVKEPTDINSLADEYLRLSYQGLRAKDKSLNAELKTDFDESIGKINIIPQDIGRVLLNLYNNAFYACAERSRSTVNEQKSKNLISYEPTVSVTTEKSDNYVIITVSDNGNGIPQKIVDKIFQPFFTTKPTGQGTGLGLSLSYDIIKAHGGEIKVESKESEGAKFIIQLPVI